jgi:hypothetical protein
MGFDLIYLELCGDLLIESYKLSLVRMAIGPSPAIFLGIEKFNY